VSARRGRGGPVALARLKVAIARAEAEMRKPPAEDEVKQILPLPAYLDDDANSAKWDVASSLRDHHRPLYNRFGSEHFLAETVVELIHNSAEGIESWGDLLSGLEHFVDESSEWIVSVPLSNATVEGYTEISERIGLAELTQDKDWDRLADPPVDAMTISRHLPEQSIQFKRPKSEIDTLKGYFGVTAGSRAGEKAWEFVFEVEDL
jgi:hypothetical protein